MSYSKRKQLLISARDQFYKINNHAETLIEELAAINRHNLEYVALIFDLESDELPEGLIRLGTKVESKRDYNVPAGRLLRKPISVYGVSGSGKTTLVVRILYDLLYGKNGINQFITIGDKTYRLNVKIFDPDKDVLQAFRKHPCVSYHDMSEMDDIDKWDLATTTYINSLKRPLADECEDFEILVFEEAEDLIPEKGESLDDLDSDEIEAMTRCFKKAKHHARKARKRASIPIYIIQNIFGFRKSVLRQIKTHFVHQLEDKEQIKKLSKPWFMMHMYDIIQAPQGRCFAYGDGIPTRSMIFDTAQVDELKTADV